MPRQDDTPRDLLFGLLALQNGLINQDHLVAAFGAWSRDKGRAMADILVDRGDLDSDERSALEMMVALQLKKNGDDIEKSLAAVGAGPSTLEKLTALGEPDLATTVARISTSATEPDEATPLMAVGTSSSGNQRFRVLRPHARGGLGAVYVALDGELNREVALKQILDHHADDPSSRARFLLEAEITGGLEHPGIVPVYGLGHYRDGRPFYAMRFIRGDSLKEAIARFHEGEAARDDSGRRSLELRKLLRRFVDVCNAIEYAHTRGVLHRDIKPGNVIVGRHGETLVVDWGLAKATGRHESEAAEERTLMPASGSGTAETLPGSALGTPAYMSPEQAAGDLANLGTRSDVYSLGATLYCLLTGGPPFAGGDVAATLRSVREGGFRPPRQVRPAVDPALEAVCLRAMAREPGSRYATPRELAEDVERWMADEPVTAFRESRARRLARWARRHTSLVAAAGALLSTGLVALALSTWLISRERDRVERAGAELARANLALSEQKDKVEKARKEADDGYRLAREAVQKLLRDVANYRLVGNPQAEALRVSLSEEALRSYRLFDKQRPDDPEIRLELARVEEQTASLYRMIGKYDRAKDGYTAATGLLKSLREREDRPRYREILAHTEAQFGELIRLSGGRVAVAEPHYREAARLSLDLKQADPADPKYDSLVARNLGDLANLLQRTGRYAEAESFARIAAERARALQATLPATLDPKSFASARLILPMSLSGHGAALARVDRRAEAEAALREAVAALRTLSKAYPSLNDVQYLLADALNDLGRVVAADPSRRADALAAQDEAIGLIEPLISRYPSVVVYPRALATFRADRGATRVEAGDLDGARLDLEAARSALEEQAARQKDSAGLLQQLGKAEGDLARLEAARGRVEPARALFREAIGHQQKALALDPDARINEELLERHRDGLRALEGR